jgi:MscS family membrane protein
MHESEILTYLSKYFDQKSDVSIVIELMVLLLATLAVSIMANRFLIKLKKAFKRTDTYWDDAVIKSIKKPLQFIIWSSGILLSMELTNTIYKLQIAEHIDATQSISFIVAMFWFLMALINDVERHSYELVDLEQSDIDKTSIGAVSKLAKLAVMLVTIIAMLQAFGVNMNAIVGAAAGGTAALGFAAKDLFGNYFGALMIYLDKPFKVGDWVRIPEKSIEGYIEKIGLRSTIIKSLDRRPMFVPNSFFATYTIENPSNMTHRRIYETIGLRAEDLPVVSSIVNAIEKKLIKNAAIDKDEPLIVKLDSFSSTSVNILVYAFTKKTEMAEFHALKHEIMMMIGEVIERYEAKLVQLSSAIITNDPLIKQLEKPKYEGKSK